MAFTTRALVLLAIVLCLQGIAAQPLIYEEETSENFPMAKSGGTMLSFEACKKAGLEVINHFKEIHSIALEYVTLTSHVTSQSLQCMVSNTDGIIKCISGVMNDHRPSYDLLHKSIVLLVKSLLNNIKDLLLCPFH